MDKLIIQDLEIFANHGVLEEEKKLGQKFVVSLEIWLDMEKSGGSDRIEDTLHYGELCGEIDALLRERSYDLIEAAAEAVCEYILMEHPQTRRVKIRLKKPWAPIRLPLAYAAVEMERSRHLVYIALGSNLGDREKNVRDALSLLDRDPHCRVIQASGLYETEPVGYEDQGKFINAAASVETLLSPRGLMTLLLETESSLKRERTIRWGPRTIDMDILLYDDLVSPDTFVTIPHPRMEDRLFVMEPLCEIAPYAVHPLLNKTMERIKDELEAVGRGR